MHRLWLMPATLLLTVSFSGCHRPRYRSEIFRTTGFRFGAGSAVVGRASDTLRIAVVVLNDTHERREGTRVEVGDLRTKAFDVFRLGRQGDSARCMGSQRVALLSPGAFDTFVLEVPVREVLGDSLPAGRYRVTAALAINGDRARGLEAGRIELAAPIQ